MGLFLLLKDVGHPHRRHFMTAATHPSTNSATLWLYCVPVWKQHAPGAWVLKATVCSNLMILLWNQPNGNIRRKPVCVCVCVWLLEHIHFINAETLLIIALSISQASHRFESLPRRRAGANMIFLDNNTKTDLFIAHVVWLTSAFVALRWFIAAE